MAQQYPPIAPVNGINQNLFPFKVIKRFFKQYYKETPLLTLSGPETNRPIVLHQMKNGDGWQYRVPKLNMLDYTNPVMGFNQVSGQEQVQSVDYDYINTDAYSFSVILKGRELIDLGTPIDLPSQVDNQLRQACRLNLNKSLLDAAMTGNYNPATQQPSYDRVVLSGVDPTRNVYNGYGNLNTAIATMNTGVAYTQNGLSASHLLDVLRCATRGGKTDGAVMVNGDTIEDQIQPAYIKMQNGWPANEYIYFCPPEAIKQLYLDPLFADSTTKRGTVTSPNQPELISGADYVGRFNGINIYCVNDLSKYLITNGGVTAAWCLLIGAAAWSLGWDRQPWLVFEEDRKNMSQSWTSHEIRGQDCLKFAAKQPVANGNSTVEQGIIHSFVRVK